MRILLALLLVPAAALADGTSLPRPPPSGAPAPAAPPPPKASVPAAEPAAAGKGSAVEPSAPDADDGRERAADGERMKKEKPRVDLDLDERIRPVSGALFRRAGRHELGPFAGISLADAFFTKYLVGARYAWHAGETLSFGLFGSYASSSPSGAVARCNSSGQGCRTPTRGDLRRTPGDFTMNVGADAAWAPLYGKISVLAESVLHFDTYLLAGGGALQTRIVPPGADSTEESWTPEGHVALGQRYYLGPWGTLRLELRDMLYGIEVQGRTGPVQRLENQLLFNVGLSFFLGRSPES